MSHYRCYKVYLPSTQKIIVTDTIEYAEDNLFDIPYSSKEDELLDVAKQLEHLLKDEAPMNSHPLSPQQQAIEKLKSTLLNNSNYPAAHPRVSSQQSLPRVDI